MWYPYNEGTPGLLAAVTKWENNFKLAHPKVTFKGQFVAYDQFTQKLVAAGATGQGPDVMFIAGPTIPDLAEADVLADLSSEWKSYPDAAQFPTALEVGSNSFAGKQYGVQAYANLEGLYVNKTLLTKLRLQMPTSKAEFESALAAAQQAGYVGFTGAANTGGGGEFSADALAASNGWTYADPTNPGMQNALTTQAQWVAKGWRQKNDSTGYVNTDNMLTGKYLFAQDGNWQLTNYQANAKFDWQVISVPGVLDRAVIGGETMAVGAHAKDKALAWKFITEAVMSKSGGEVAALAGSVPLRQDVVKSSKLKSDENLSVFASLAAKSIYIQLSSNSGKVSSLIGDVYSAVIAGQSTGEDGAKKIYSKLPALLAK